MSERVVVSDAAIDAVLGTNGAESPAGGNARWGGNGYAADSKEWLRGWVERYFPNAEEKVKADFELLWEFPECPFNAEHNRHEAAVGKPVGKGFWFHCPHNGCHGRGWKELRDLADPGWQERRSEGGSVSSVSSVNQGSDFQWGPPIEFRDLARPPFPTHALPSWLEDFVMALAAETQTPPDLAALLGLGACAAALARKVKIRPRRGWEEPVNLYVVVALPPAARKSAVFKAVAAPLIAYERDRISEEAAGIAAAHEARSIVEKRLQQARNAASREDSDGPGSMAAEAKRLAQEVAAMKPPVALKMVCDDVTPEKLANLIFEQGGRMALLSAEGGIFGIMQGRYSQGLPNFEVFLKAHSGDELRVDRLGRGSEYVSAPALTIGLAVQPSVIRRVPPEFRERGLMGRCLYSLPASGVGHRDEDPPLMPEAIAEEYHRNLTALLELPFDSESEPHALIPTQEGLARLVAFMRKLEPRLDEETGDLGQMGDWAGKLVGAIARVAGMLHCARHWRYQAPWEFPVEWQTAEQAIVIGEYLLAHARAAYDQMGADSSLDRARRMLRWIQRHRVTEFRRRDLHRGPMGSEGTVTDLDAGLQVLVEHGYVRSARVTSPGLQGGRPAEVFAVNPAVLENRTAV